MPERPSEPGKGIGTGFLRLPRGRLPRTAPGRQAHGKKKEAEQESSGAEPSHLHPSLDLAVGTVLSSRISGVASPLRCPNLFPAESAPVAAPAGPRGRAGRWARAPAERGRPRCRPSPWPGRGLSPDGAGRGWAGLALASRVGRFKTPRCWESQRERHGTVGRAPGRGGEDPWPDPACILGGRGEGALCTCSSVACCSLALRAATHLFPRAIPGWVQEEAPGWHHLRAAWQDRRRGRTCRCCRRRWRERRAARTGEERAGRRVATARPSPFAPGRLRVGSVGLPGSGVEQERAVAAASLPCPALPCPDPRASSERAALFCTAPLPVSGLDWVVRGAAAACVGGSDGSQEQNWASAPLSSCPPTRRKGPPGGNAKPSSRPPSGRGRSSGAGAGSCLKRGARMGWGADRHG